MRIQFIAKVPIVSLYLRIFYIYIFSPDHRISYSGKKIVWNWFVSEKCVASSLRDRLNNGSEPNVLPLK